MTTERQKAAVRFCQETLNVPFNGGINNFKEVSSFLSEYLDDAKEFRSDMLSNWHDDICF